MPRPPEENRGFAERKDEILRAAAGLIRRRGFAATRMADVGEAVHLTKAGLYHYVANKEELLAAIFDLALEALWREVVEPSRRVIEPEARLNAIVERYIDLVLHERELLAVVAEEADRLPPPARRRFARRQRDFCDELAALLVELRVRGRLRSLDPRVAARNLLSVVQAVPRWFSPHGRLEAGEVRRESHRFLVAGLLYD